MPLVVVAEILHHHIAIKAANQDKLDRQENVVIAMGAINNIRTVMALAAEPYFLEQFSQRYMAIRNRTIRIAITASPLFSFTLASIVWTVAITFSLGSHLMDINATDFSIIIRIFVLINFSVIIFYGFALGKHSPAVPDQKRARSATKNIIRVMNHRNKIDVEDPETCESLAAKQMKEMSCLRNKKCKGGIEFKNVSFSYPAKPFVNVLNGISFSVEPGQRVAICGPSGGGKSTIMNLLLRFHDPKYGQITIDGNDLTSVNVRWLRSNIGHVLQDPVLFSMSVGENVQYGSENSNQQEVESACASANILEFIETLPEQFNSQTGENGITQLTNSQKQRIAIAR